MTLQITLAFSYNITGLMYQQKLVSNKTLNLNKQNYMGDMIKSPTSAEFSVLVLQLVLISFLLKIYILGLAMLI